MSDPTNRAKIPGNLARQDGRLPAELRPITFERDYTKMTPGSVLVSFGDTKVLCTVSYDMRVPRWMRGSGQGWITAEYSLLPGSSPERVTREATAGKLKGRTQEIQRLIGRSLRAVCDISEMGECSLNIDCDVIQADGGTRTAAVTGASVALFDAGTRLLAEGKLAKHPMKELCAAVSVGVVDKRVLLDLPYAEDSKAQVDMNVVVSESGKFIEVQGTAEEAPFSREQLNKMLALAEEGASEIIQLQRASLGLSA